MPTFVVEPHRIKVQFPHRVLVGQRAQLLFAALDDDGGCAGVCTCVVWNGQSRESYQQE
jgi:hypothetical protein